jgi:DNA-binding NarL/FixJ family response regulator
MATMCFARSAITLCLVDADGLYRTNLEHSISLDPRFAIRGSFRDTETALSQLIQAAPDLIVLDTAPRGAHGADCIRQLLIAAPQVRLLVLTNPTDDNSIFEALRAGAHGFLQKTSISTAQVCNELHALYRGEHPLCPKAAAIALRAFRAYYGNRSRPATLTRREYEVALLLADGKTNAEIAVALGVSPYTVYTHVQRILAKTTSHNRLEAVAKLWGRP